jgi:shikimate dehydrogenase
MKKQLRFIFLLLILSGLASTRLKAQTFGSEAELKEQAAKLFDDDQFEEAYPLYAQLASIYNKDPNINYRLGVCMLYASEDKEKPIPFLELAAKYTDVEKEVFFYLAKAYHLNYRFDDAIKQYQAYAKVASGPKAEKLQVQRQIEMCKNGKRLLRNISDLIVIDKKEMSRADFYRSYDISAIGGKLLAKPDEDTFKTPIDKKKKESSIIYFSSDNNQIYFASYGDHEYHLFPIKQIEELPQLIKKYPELKGLNVTIPYKESVIPFLDELNETAKEIGAVNCIRILTDEDHPSGKKLIGYNTDAFGFRQSIKPFLETQHERALILGTGGASKAVHYVLKSIGIDCFFVTRTKIIDNQLITKNEFSYEELNEYVISAFKLIVNTTPVGMSPHVEEAPAIPYEFITPSHLLYDLVYNPLETQFLKKGKEKGACTVNGLSMLHQQAEEAWRIWNP